ncbi:MAG: AI-2E family transporter [Polaromonas sp.]|nr:AI-2E family transporter [Gemmatimonadaceae bacterium]
MPDSGRATSTPDRARRARIIIAVLATGVAWACLPYVAGLLGAVVLSVIATPIHRLIAPKMGERRSAFLITVVFALVLAAPAVLLLSMSIRQAPMALQKVLESAAFARLSELRIGELDVGEQIADIGRNMVSWGSSRAMATAGSFTRVVLNLLLALVGLYYLLPNRTELWRRARAFIPFSDEGCERLAEQFASITEAAMLGIVATAFSQGLTVGLGFWLVSLPNPVFWGSVTALVSILPILGSALVWAPAVVVLFLDARPGAALTLALIGVVIASNVDNVIRPFIYRRVSGLHPMVSLLGAFAGMKLLGLLGLVLGPLALAYCMELVHLYRIEYAASESLSHDVVAP